MKSQARWLAVLACVMALAGCASESRSGTNTDQQRERNNEPDGMSRGGGGGY